MATAATGVGARLTLVEEIEVLEVVVETVVLLAVLDVDVELVVDVLVAVLDVLIDVLVVVAIVLEVKLDVVLVMDDEKVVVDRAVVDIVVGALLLVEVLLAMIVVLIVVGTKELELLELDFDVAKTVLVVILELSAVVEELEAEVLFVDVVDTVVAELDFPVEDLLDDWVVPLVVRTAAIAACGLPLTVAKGTLEDSALELDTLAILFVALYTCIRYPAPHRWYESALQGIEQSESATLLDLGAS